ncbi:hypothetical protein SDJN02_14090, partial [Cucurbita argyrosperma subsp. argyrosperma]
KRRDAQQQARSLASTLLSLSSTFNEPITSEPDEFNEPAPIDLDVLQALKLKGSQARKWFSKQLLLPECVLARPSGKRCFVVSSNGTTISRLRNGSILHRFPSALPNGAKTKKCLWIRFECPVDGQTYYVIDMIC